MVIARRARELLFVWPIDRAVTAAVARKPASISALGEAGGDSAAAEVARAIIEADPTERAIASADALADVRARVVERLAWLRVMAPAASGLGLAGAAVQAGWARHPPGLLALDPDRVLGMAASAGATCVALGIAGSTTALGALFFLRRRALAILTSAEAVARAAGGERADAWTQGAR